MNAMARHIMLVISVATLVLIVWSATRSVSQPQLSISWDSANGHIEYVEPTTPFQLDDTVVAIDGLPIEESAFPFFYWNKGDIVEVTVLRDDQPLTFDVPLIYRVPLLDVIRELLVLLVALAFWLVSTAVVQYRYRHSITTILLFCWCQLMALVLAFGNVSIPSWPAYLSIGLVWLLVPTIVNFHLVFPIKQMGKGYRPFTAAGYTIGLLGFLLSVELAFRSAESNWLFDLFGISYLPWISLGLVIVLALLIRAMVRLEDGIERQQVGVIVLSTCIGFLPFLIFTLVPTFLFDDDIIAANYTLLCMSFIPLGYGYAINKFRIIPLERYINRSASLVMTGFLLIAIYFAIIVVTQWFVNPLTDSPYTLVGLVAAFIPTILANPINKGVNKWITKQFYGGWYDYSSVVEAVSTTINENMNSLTFVESLGSVLQRAMRVKWVGVLLPHADTKEKYEAWFGHGHPPMELDRVTLEYIPHIVAQLKTRLSPTTVLALRESLADSSLNETESSLMAIEDAKLWVPVLGHRGTIGVIILGPKHGGSMFNETDLDILVVTARQISMALQNVQLITSLEQQVQESELYQRRLVTVRTDERKRIARDLHDNVIQELVGFRYQLAELQSADSPSSPIASDGRISQSLRELIQTTRDLCYDLRPPALDLGLVSGVRSLIGRFEERHHIAIELNVEGDRAIEIAEEVTMCIFQCTQEALNNVIKHAHAMQVEVSLLLSSCEIECRITDNGIGFALPERLGHLMAQKHFGLVGIRERVELIAGTFHLQSDPGNGTTIILRLPTAVAV